MYKVGDEVLIKGEVIEVMNDVPYPVRVRLGSDNGGIVFTNDEACYADKIVKTYEQGLADAWELAGKLVFSEKNGGFNVRRIEEIFGTQRYPDVFRWFTAEEALAKIEDYERTKEIKVNSIVENSMGVLGVVTRDENTNVYVMWTDGSCGKREKKCLKNTGRTANTLTALLQQIKE